MKTQISNHNHQPEKRYSGVYQQQGRMVTDADWNELNDIIKQRVNDALRDIVGSGVPWQEASPEIIVADGKEVKIRPGPIYVDGIRAVLTAIADNGIDPAVPFALYQQQDFPLAQQNLPPTPGNPGKYKIYADIWERTVVSLEDGYLSDPALNGADTCFRTQTMAQIKWCSEAVDPDDPSLNPRIGNATLLVEQRTEGELIEGASGACDPCEAKIANLDQPIGNYLFRLEVHDIEFDDNDKPNRLVLKWSKENGAEHHPIGQDVTDLPPGFVTSLAIYEFYSDESEKHLGVHLATDFIPARGKLEPQYPPSTQKHDRYVRRWDGYCELERLADGEWAIKKDEQNSLLGKDEGATLTAFWKSDEITLNLQRLTLTIDLADKLFVPGDYWLTVVRENAPDDQRVRQLGPVVIVNKTSPENPDVDIASRRHTPMGIKHHYLTLAEAEYTKEGVEVAYVSRHPSFRFHPMTNLSDETVPLNEPEELPSPLKDQTNTREALIALNALIPIGSIMSYVGEEKDLPDSWKVCNGQLLNDSESPFHNQNLPDLRERFLRGSGTFVPTGTMGGIDFAPNHSHFASLSGDVSIGSRSLTFGSGHFATKGSSFSDNIVLLSRLKNLGIRDQDTHGHIGSSFVSGSVNSGGSHDNRPRFYTVQFILRVH